MKYFLMLSIVFVASIAQAHNGIQIAVMDNKDGTTGWVVEYEYILATSNDFACRD